AADPPVTVANVARLGQEVGQGAAVEHPLALPARGEQFVAARAEGPDQVFEKSDGVRRQDFAPPIVERAGDGQAVHDFPLYHAASAVRPAASIPAIAQVSSRSDVSPVIPTAPMTRPSPSRMRTPP